MVVVSCSKSCAAVLEPAGIREEMIDSDRLLATHRSRRLQSGPERHQATARSKAMDSALS